MLKYATPEDLAASDWATDPEPGNVEALLRSASMLVTRKTKTAVYDVTPAGMPCDPDLVAVFRDATCAQAASWVAAGIDPTGGRAAAASPPVTTKTIGTASIAYAGAAASQSARAAALDELCPDAENLLVLAGLLQGPVITW